MSKKSNGDSWLESVIETLRVKEPTQEALEEPTRPTRTREVVPRRVGLSEEQRREYRRDKDRSREDTLRGKYKRLRKYCRYHGPRCPEQNWVLALSFEEWTRLWKAAGEVYFQGRWVPAWKARVQRKRLDKKVPYKLTEGVQLKRVDPSKDWSLDNMKVVYNRRTLANGADLV